MKFSNSILALCIICTHYSCGNKMQTIDDKFNGMWKLDKYEFLDTKLGKWIDDTSRRGFNGYILYDGKGHMGVHLLLKNGYKDVDTNKNVDSLDKESLIKLVKFYRSNFVYFADYVITNTSIIHKRHTATDPKDWGSELTRDFEFRGDTLILTAHERIKNKKIRLRWIKLN